MAVLVFGKVKREALLVQVAPALCKLKCQLIQIYHVERER